MSSITVIVPALNEEENIQATLRMLQRVLPKHFSDWEILVFNDGSRDKTGELAEAVCRKNPKIKVIHHVVPHNLGGCYKEGVTLATKQYVIMVPGDNECGESVLKAVFEHQGQADIIIPYTSNHEVRPLLRQGLSHLFTATLNFLSRQKITYYNGTVLHKTAIIKTCPIQTNSFAYQAEALVCLLRKGHNFLEIPIKINYRKNGKSKALRLNNLIETALCLTALALNSRSDLK